MVASGEPSGLSLTLPPVLAQLTEARTAATAAGSSNPGLPVVVFDRGGSYPKTFKAVHAAGYDWISWRRAPLAATSRLPVLATIRQYGTDRVIAFTDEVIALDGYPEPVRQISLFEHGKMVAQLLTSCLRPCAGALLGLLRSRWIIENFLKYNAANYGIDTLADYTADLADDTRLTANPAYAQAKKAEQAASSALAGAQAALAAMLADPAIPAREKNASLIPAAHKKITACERDLAAATAARKGLRSKIPRNQLRPGAQKALLRPGLWLPAARPAAARGQRRAAPRRPPQRLPARRRRIPGHHPRDHPARPRRHHHLHRRRDHRHPGPAQPAQNRPRPGLPPRRDQHQAAGHPRRPPAHHLPARDLTIINKSRAPNCWRSGPGCLLARPVPGRGRVCGRG